MAPKLTYPLGLPSKKAAPPVFVPNRKKIAAAQLAAAPSGPPPETGPRMVPVPWDESYYVVYGIEPPVPPVGVFTLTINTTLGVEADISWLGSNPPPATYTLQYVAMAGATLVFVKEQGPDLILNIIDPLDWQVLSYIRPIDSANLSPGETLFCWIQATSGSDAWMLASFVVNVTGPGGSVGRRRRFS